MNRGGIGIERLSNTRTKANCFERCKSFLTESNKRDVECVFFFDGWGRNFAISKRSKCFSFPVIVICNLSLLACYSV